MSEQKEGDILGNPILIIANYIDDILAIIKSVK